MKPHYSIRFYPGITVQTAWLLIGSVIFLRAWYRMHIITSKDNFFVVPYSNGVYIAIKK